MKHNALVLITCVFCFIVSWTGPACVAKPRVLANSLIGARTEIYKTIDDVKLSIHVFEPSGLRAGDKRPAIVFFFGGGWRAGTPKQFEKHCSYLASRGMVAMAVEYRVKNRHGVKVVSCFSDSKSAIRWVRQYARRLGVDPDRIAAAGGSAGGHLAGALGTIDGFDAPTDDISISAVPNALVLFNPVLILAPIEGHEITESKYARLKERIGAPPIQLSPYHHLDDDLPPTIILHGTDDKTVPYRNVELFANAAKKKGNAVELVPYKGRGHGFFNYKARANLDFVDTVKKVDAFLVSLRYLQGPNTVDAFVDKIK